MSTEAEEKLKERPKDLIDEEEFIEDSIKLRDKEKNNTIWTLSVSLIVALLLLTFSGLQWQRANGQSVEAKKQTEVANQERNRAKTLSNCYLQAAKASRQRKARGIFGMGVGAESERLLADLEQCDEIVARSS